MVISTYLQIYFMIILLLFFLLGLDVFSTYLQKKN